MRVTAPEKHSRFAGQSGEVVSTYTERALPLKGHAFTREIVQVKMDNGVVTYFVLKECKRL